MTGLAGVWRQVTDLTATVAPAGWIAFVGALFVGSIATLPYARRQARNAGARAAGHAPAATRRERLLFLAALIPAFGFLIAVLAGSQRGLVAFGRDDLHWHDGWEFLVPLTLDGVGLSFGFLAFRAVDKERSPHRAVAVAWGAAIASATINFFHESGLLGGSTLGGLYLALLSLFVMVMFHELLDQFTEGTEYIRRDNPAFKLRWLTWPSNTACAWVAWRNYPVADGTPATVAAAVAHLDEVRTLKRDARRVRLAQSPDAPWWTPLAPWLRVRDLNVVLAEQRTAREAERAELAALLEAERSSGAAALLEAEQLAERLAAERAEHTAERDDLCRRIGEAERARAAALSEVAVRSTQPDDAERSSTGRTKQARSAGTPNAPRLTDDEAVQAMLRAHRSADYEWTSREVHRITGAGFGRIPKLIAAVAEHHRSTSERAGAEHHGAPADSTEQPNITNPEEHAS